MILGYADGRLEVLARGQVTHTLALGERVELLVVSPDHHWLAAQLGSGATAIVDTSTWAVARVLPAADAYGAAPEFDAGGELLLRTSRNTITIWDRATGEELVFGFDLLRNIMNARFLPDGRLEVSDREPALVDIPRDVRPIAQILRDLACKVPLQVSEYPSAA